MPLSETYVGSSTPRVIVRYLLSKGFLTSPIEARLKAPVTALESEDFRLPFKHYLKLWEHAIKVTDDPALGLKLGCRFDEEEIGLVGHIFFSNATLQNAIKQYQRYFSITNEAMRVELVTEASKAKLRFQCLETELYCIPDIERTIAAGITRARQQIEQTLPIDYISVQHKRPSYGACYQQLLSCPIEFSAEHTEIVFDVKYLTFRLPHKSSSLQKVLSKHLDSLLSKISAKHSTSSQVAKLIKKRLATDAIDSEQIARKLNMSRQTLYRKLNSENISFHELVEQVRKERALHYLTQEQYSLSQIAFLLGFSELSAFSRAFKRWTGVSPGKYKKQN